MKKLKLLYVSKINKIKFLNLQTRKYSKVGEYINGYFLNLFFINFDSVKFFYFPFIYS